MPTLHSLDISIDNENQLFNSMDPAPFRSRELDAAVIDYVVAWAENAPSDVALGVVITLSAGVPGDRLTDHVSGAFVENFRRLAEAKRRELARLFKDGRISLVVGLAFVGLAISISDWVSAAFATSHYAQIVADSFIIGAWVALWHPTNIFLYEWWPLRRQALLYDRLSSMDVTVIAA